MESIYAATASFPREEQFALTSQLRRAAISVPSNIAEGAARNTAKEFIQFLHIALASLSEIETQVIIAERLGYLEEVAELGERIASVRRLVLGLLRYVKSRDRKE